MQDFDEHRDELNEAPFLRSLKKENIFRTPDDYFESIPQLWADTADESEPETPLLDQIEKKNIFQIPEGYFDTFAENISLISQSSASEISPRRGLVKSIVFVRRFSIGIAAAIALLISLGIWFSVPENDLPGQSELLADISTEELITGVDLAEVDLSTILDIVGDEVLEDLQLQESPADHHIEEINELLEEMDISDLEGMLEELDK